MREKERKKERVTGPAFLEICNFRGHVHLRHDLRFDLRFDCGLVPASSCQRKGMPSHDDAGTESQVITQVMTQVDTAL
jgi:hypothetical protein